MNGRTFICDSCNYEWQRYRHKYRFGPDSDVTRALRCPFCDFSLYFPITADQNSWQRWTDQQSPCLDAVPRLSELATRVAGSLPTSRYTPAKFYNCGLDCIGCDRPMRECDDDITCCPDCLKSTTRVTGEFADSISYIDPSDVLRWWLRVGL